MMLTIHRDYPCNPKNDQGVRVRPVDYLVIHYVGALGGAEQNAKYYHSTPGIGASAHLFVGHGPDAEVWASVAEGRVASHCGRTDGKYVHPACRNANSIGIELCCRKDAAGKWGFDPETLDAAVELTRELMERYGIDADHVLRHYDVTGKCCPAPFVLDEGAWADFKERLEEGSMTQRQFDVMMADYLRRQNEKLPSGWAREAWDRAVRANLFDGTMPQGIFTREQAAAVLARLGLVGEES